MKNINLHSVTWKEGAYYVSQCLDVDVSSFGKTKKEAEHMLKEALELYKESHLNKMIQEAKQEYRAKKTKGFTDPNKLIAYLNT